MPNASDSVTLVLNQRVRMQLRKALKGYSSPGWRPAGVEGQWWARFAKGQVEKVDMPTWRLIASWFPAIRRLLGPPF